MTELSVTSKILAGRSPARDGSGISSLQAARAPATIHMNSDFAICDFVICITEPFCEFRTMMA
ncbi:MAG: hypothetical protein ACFB6R_07610 [Alphaproteobacteria bacterium]